MRYRHVFPGWWRVIIAVRVECPSWSTCLSVIFFDLVLGWCSGVLVNFDWLHVLPMFWLERSLAYSSCWSEIEPARATVGGASCGPMVATFQNLVGGNGAKSDPQTGGYTSTVWEYRQQEFWSKPVKLATGFNHLYFSFISLTWHHDPSWLSHMKNPAPRSTWCRRAPHEALIPKMSQFCR